MIEIVYRDDNDSHDEVSIKLPKNIKQIGDTKGNIKIYFEEMVMEMIKEKTRYGVLLGYIKHVGSCSYVFINGAIMAVNSPAERSLNFDEKVWTGIHQDIKNYYETPEIVGWFVSEQDKCISIDNIRRIHLDNFPGKDKICILNDIGENDETIYRYSNGLMEKVEGYYVYFDKNVLFERYLTRSKALEEIFDTTENNDEKEEIKKEVLPKYNIKEMIPSYMVIALLLAIIVVMNNSNQINSIKTSLSDIAGNLINTPEVETVAVETTSEVKAVVETEMVTETTTKQVKKKVEKKEETTAKIEPVVEQVFYVVKSGETLTDISRRVYNDVSRVDEIMAANDIDDADMIYEGQKILLP